MCHRFLVCPEQNKLLKIQTKSILKEKLTALRTFQGKLNVFFLMKSLNKLTRMKNV